MIPLLAHSVTLTDLLKPLAAYMVFVMVVLSALWFAFKKH